jgi:hypothetical protein
VGLLGVGEMGQAMAHVFSGDLSCLACLVLCDCDLDIKESVSQ